MISRYERLSGVTSEISRLIAKISATEMKRYGLRGSWARYILLLARYEAGITAAKLSALAARNKADVSRSLTELEEHGLVERASGGAYRAKLTLTDRGRDIADALYARTVQIVELAGAGISEGDREILYGSLERIVKNLNEISKKQGAPDSE